MPAGAFANADAHSPSARSATSSACAEGRGRYDIIARVLHGKEGEWNGTGLV